MLTIALRFSDTALAVNETFDNMISIDEQIQFECVDLKRPILDVKVEAGTTLSGRNYQHQKFVHKFWTCTISSNEINDNTIEFFESFWTAPFKYIVIYDYSNWSNCKYIEVLTEGGPIPITYIDDLEQLPEITFKFTTVVPIG